LNGHGIDPWGSRNRPDDVGAAVLPGSLKTAPVCVKREVSLPAPAPAAAVVVARCRGLVIAQSGPALPRHGYAQEEAAAPAREAALTRRVPLRRQAACVVPGADCRRWFQPATQVAKVDASCRGAARVEWLSYKVRIMYKLADGVWQPPLVPRDAINAYLIREVLVDPDRGPV
jgi:hypothetical protein